MEMEVVWNGGPLLPERCEGVGPMWRNMLTEREAGLFARVMAAGSRIQQAVGTGRYCRCGCGEEMRYSPQTKAKDQGQYKMGHNPEIRGQLRMGQRPGAKSREGRHRSARPGQ